ncbi:MAG: tRNA (adenosine(37)-N6)-threonylcarbamoyltransferase complex ATPase subunit type 1 TsaE [Bdellovibrio sp.]|jgi:tRNA threonylcarbamoyladenosine biosynthesis protein TsaE
MLGSSGSVEISDLESFQSWIQLFQKSLQGNEIVLISGDMGAGKTEFVKRLSRLYGFEGAVSPTFALHHAMQSSLKKIDHFDLYRLESADELESIGLWDILEDPESLVLIEWPERVPVQYWPRARNKITLKISKVDSGLRRHLAWQKL